MRAPVRGVIQTKHDFAGQRPLDSEVPLVDLGISRRSCAQIVVVAVPPIGERAVLHTLRTRKSPWKWIFHGRGLSCKIVVCEEHGGRFTERGARILKVSSGAHSEIYARPAAHHRLRVDLISKTQSRPKVFAIRRNASAAGGRELRSAEQLLRRRKIRDPQHHCLRTQGACRRASWNVCKIDVYSAVGGEIAEFEAVVALVVWRAPLVTQT